MKFLLSLLLYVATFNKLIYTFECFIRHGICLDLLTFQGYRLALT
jgi:hypothetical protein